MPLVSTFHFLNYTRLKSNHFAIPELVATDPFHFIYQLFDDRTINISDKVILVSKNTRDILIKKYKSKCNKFEYMPNFVDTILFSPCAVEKRSNRTNGEFNILFVGRLERSKGFDQMVKVMDEFRQKKMPFRLNVVGNGPLERLVMDAPNINLLGRVDNNKLPGVYNSNDCFILSSVYENCPMSIIEAMSCGSRS